MSEPKQPQTELSEDELESVSGGMTYQAGAPKIAAVPPDPCVSPGPCAPPDPCRPGVVIPQKLGG
ncbi:MAG TPA: bacteriocin [Polyangiaceae bacterium]|nr:bacteriocin [Polyangiaceae bacterium]